MTDIERLFGGARKPTDFKDSETPDVKSVTRPSGVRVAVRRPPGQDPLPPIGRTVARPATLPVGREVVRLPPAPEVSVPLIRSRAERDRAAADLARSAAASAEPLTVAASTVASSTVDPDAARLSETPLPGAPGALTAAAPQTAAQPADADPRDERLAANRYRPTRMLRRHSHYSVLLADDSSLHREVVLVTPNRCLPSFAPALLPSPPARADAAAANGAAIGPAAATKAPLQWPAGVTSGAAALDPAVAPDVAPDAAPDAATPDTSQMLAAAFRRHVAVAAGLRHPNIVATLDLGRTDGAAFLVFERVEARSLRALLAGDWRPTLPDALGLAVALADALRYAHGLGVAHGALGPEHLYVGADGGLKIAGFGGWTDIGADALAAPLAGPADFIAEPSTAMAAAVDAADSAVAKVDAAAPVAAKVDAAAPVAAKVDAAAPVAAKVDAASPFAAKVDAAAATATTPAQATGAADFFAATGHAGAPEPMVPPESIQPDEWRRADLRVLADVFELLVRRAQVSARAGAALPGDDPAASAPLLNLPQDIAELARRTRADDRDADPAAVRGNAAAARVAVGRTALAPPPDAAQWHARLTLLWLHERVDPWPGVRLHPLAPTVAPIVVDSDAMDPTAALAALVAAAPSPREGDVVGPSARGLTVAGPAPRERSVAPPSFDAVAGAGPVSARSQPFPWRWVASGALAAGLVAAALFGTSRTSFVPAGSRDVTARALPDDAGGAPTDAAAGGRRAFAPVDPGRPGVAPTVRVAPPAAGFAATSRERDAAALVGLAGASPVIAGMRVTPESPQGASGTATPAGVAPRAGAAGVAGVAPGATLTDGALAQVTPAGTPSASGAVRARPARASVRSANADTGQLRLGITPWGEVYVDGALRGVTPPLDRLSLAPGTYAVEIRNAGATSLRRTLVIHPGESVSISHQF